MWGNLSINQKFPPHELKDKELVNANNFRFDYEKGQSLMPRAAFRTLEPTSDTLFVPPTDTFITGEGKTVYNGPYSSGTTSYNHVRPAIIAPVIKVPTPTRFPRCPTIPIPPSLFGLGWKLPCITHDGGGVPSCSCIANVTTSITFPAQPTSGTKTVVARIRGIVETKIITGGTNDGQFFQKDGALAGDTWNVYKLTISSPAQTYYVNRAWASAPSEVYQTYAMDYTCSFLANAGAVITFFADAIDLDEITNFDNLSVPDDDPTRPIIVAQPYDGQFVQLDVLSIS